MVKDEVRRFLQSQDSFSCSDCAALIDAIPAENTVAAFAWCGETVGISFLSSNFHKIFGYDSNLFGEEGVDFITSRVHPNDLSSFFEFLEASHKPVACWFQNPDKAVFEHTYRLKHGSGRWIWIKEKLMVLSLTPEGLLDKVFIVFTDVSDWKNKSEEERFASLCAKGKKNKLVESLIKYKKLQEEKNASTSLDQHVLTQREKQILNLVSKGYSSKQIAQYLFISRHTVESHRKHLLKKLKVNNAAELVQKASASSS